MYVGPPIRHKLKFVTCFVNVYRVSGDFENGVIVKIYKSKAYPILVGGACATPI